jgi:hypothetical protein
MSVRRHHNHGLKKRCSCPRTNWSRCPHPWHFGFHWAGHEHRYSLHVIAQRDRFYVMSKSEAQGLADTLRSDIRHGRRLPAPSKGLAVAATAPLTFTDVAAVYIKRHVWVPSRRKRAAESIEGYVRILERLPVPVADGTAAMGIRPFATLTKADLEAAREARRAEFAAVKPDDRMRPGCKGGEVGVQHLMAVARQLWNWAIQEGYVETTPFKRGGVSVIRVKTGADSPRTRRLAGEEEVERRTDRVDIRVVSDLFTPDLLRRGEQDGADKSARPGEVLVSQTVRDLVLGSSIEFRETCSYQLESVPSTWRAYAVIST